MSQQSVYKLLKKKKEWMTTKEIAKHLRINSSSVITSLNKLHRYEEIKKKKANTKRSNGQGFPSFEWKAK